MDYSALVKQPLDWSSVYTSLSPIVRDAEICIFHWLKLQKLGLDLDLLRSILSVLS